MALMHLQGKLICATPEERRLVLALLPAHMRQSLREPGCLFFEMSQDVDPLVWSIDAGFATQAAYGAHEARSRGSDWGKATLRIRRELALTPARPEIRPETPADERALFLLTRAAFGRTEEADLLGSLRLTGDLALSLVARFGRAYLGHAAFFPLQAPFPAWGLGPVSVRASVRRQRLAEGLVRAGIDCARDRGIAALFVVGDPAYYRRFGFSAEDARGYDSPYAGAEWQMLTLTGAALPQGPVSHPEVFKSLAD